MLQICAKCVLAIVLSNWSIATLVLDFFVFKTLAAYPVVPIESYVSHYVPVKGFDNVFKVGSMDCEVD